MSQLNPSDRFVIKDVISDTLQGRVYRGIDQSTNEFVAIKETWKALVHLKQCRQGTKVKEDYHSEISILQYLSQLKDCPPSIIRILSAWDEQLCYMYSMEYCQCSLFHFIKKIHEKGHMRVYCNTMQKLPQRMMSRKESVQNPYLKYIQRIFIKLAHSIHYLHSKSIVHLDLSLENVMLSDLNNNHSIKIIDFGLAKFLGTNTNETNFMLQQRCGKLSYMAPEVYSENVFYDGRKADIWSMGVTLFICLVGLQMFDKPCATDQKFCYAMEKGIKPLLKNWRRLRLINEDVLDLMNKIFVSESKRIDMEQLLAHPFLNPKRYSNDIRNESDCEMCENESVLSSVTDNSCDYQTNIDNICTEEKSESESEYPMYNRMDIRHTNSDDCSKVSDIHIAARVQSKVSISEPLTPRIGKDGTFEFGLFANVKQKYEF